MATEFSAIGWNRVTVEYLHSAKQLDKKKLQVILDDAKGLVKAKQDVDESMEGSSGRATLCSDPEDGGKNFDHRLKIALTYVNSLNISYSHFQLAFHYFVRS
jgi:hypothetical protein